MPSHVPTNVICQTLTRGSVYCRSSALAPSHPTKSAQRSARSVAGLGSAAHSARSILRPRPEKRLGSRPPAWLSSDSMGCSAVAEAVAALVPPSSCRETMGACAGIRPAGACVPTDVGLLWHGRDVGPGILLPGSSCNVPLLNFSTRVWSITCCLEIDLPPIAPVIPYPTILAEDGHSS